MNDLPTISELEDAVNSIEQDIFNSTGEVEYFTLTVISNGFVQIVEFIGIHIWDSENDPREYADVNDENTRQPIEDHLREVLNEELKKLSKISV